MLGVAPLEADDLAVDGDVLVERGDVDPLGVGDGRRRRRRRRGSCPPAGGGTGRCGCRRCRSPGWRRSCRRSSVPSLPSISRAIDGDAVAGGGLAAGRAVELDRLAGDAGRVEAVELGVLVHDPGHHLGVGADVGGGDVLVGADEVVDLLDELAGQPLELAPRELARVAVDPPLAAAEGEVDDGRLPGHQAGQRPGLVLVDVRVVAQAPLERAPGVVVLDPVADEVADLPESISMATSTRSSRSGVIISVRMLSVRSSSAAAWSK